MDRTSNILISTLIKHHPQCCRLQQLGIHIQELVAPVVAIDGMWPGLPDPDGLPDMSFVPIWVIGWQLQTFLVGGVIAYILLHGLSEQIDGVLSIAQISAHVTAMINMLET